MGLAVYRLLGSHVHQLIVLEIDRVTKQFKIQNKTQCGVTDNGSNFVCAYKIVQYQPDLLFVMDFEQERNVYNFKDL